MKKDNLQLTDPIIVCDRKEYSQTARGINTLQMIAGNLHFHSESTII